MDSEDSYSQTTVICQCELIISNKGTALMGNAGNGVTSKDGADQKHRENPHTFQSILL